MPEAWVLWDNAVPDAVSHRVERSDGDNLNFVEVFSAAQADEDYKETLADGDYWYRVRSELTPGVFSNYSNEAQVTLTTAGPAPTVYIEDTFSVADRPLAGWEPDVVSQGTMWAISGTFDIVSNQATSAVSNSLAIIRSNQEFVKAQANMVALSSDCAIMPAYVDANNFIYGSVQGGDTLQIWRRVNGAWSAVGATTGISAALPFLLKASYDSNRLVTVSVGGDSISATVADVEVQGGVNQGMQVNGSGAMTAEDFKVTDVP